MRKGGGYKNDTKLEQRERCTILIINPHKYPFYIDFVVCKNNSSVLTK